MTNPDILEHAHTAIGTIYLERYQNPVSPGWVYEMQINGQLLMSSLSPMSEMQLSSRALSLHRGEGPLEVLVGGLGLGYTAHAALATSRVTRVRVIERMDFVIDWMRGGLFPLSNELAADDRIEIAQGDIYEELLRPASERYDLILVDVDHAPDALLSCASAPFYTGLGQSVVRSHLNPGGILGVWSAYDDDDFAEVLRAAYPETHRAHVRWGGASPQTPAFHNVLFFGVEHA
jgi:spermidine synthase